MNTNWKSLSIAVTGTAVITTALFLAVLPKSAAPASKADPVAVEAEVPGAGGSAIETVPFLPGLTAKSVSTQTPVATAAPAAIAGQNPGISVDYPVRIEVINPSNRDKEDNHSTGNPRGQVQGDDRPTVTTTTVTTLPPVRPPVPPVRPPVPPVHPVRPPIPPLPPVRPPVRPPVPPVHPVRPPVPPVRPTVPPLPPFPGTPGSGPIVRDHRGTGPIVRDHRGTSPTTVPSGGSSGGGETCVRSIFGGPKVCF